MILLPMQHKLNLTELNTVREYIGQVLCVVIFLERSADQDHWAKSVHHSNSSDRDNLVFVLHVEIPN